MSDDGSYESWRQSYLAKGWKHETCGCCVNGVRADDTGGPAECRNCNGTGNVWITPKGRYVEYPGGRFV